MLRRRRGFERRCAKISRLLAWTAILLLIGGQRRVAAQSTQADRAQLFQNQTGPILPVVPPGSATESQAGASPNDTDLGEQEILKRIESYKSFTISVLSSVFYTSNVELTNSRVVSDLVEAPGGGLYYQPPIAKFLSGLFDVRAQLFYYDRYHSSDFGSLDAEAGLSYLIPQWHNLFLRAEYDFNLLTSLDHGINETFENHSIIVDAEIPFHINRAQVISLGADPNISVAADRESQRRNNYEVYALYSMAVTRSLSLDASGRVIVRQYYANNRTDVSEAFALNATVRLSYWCTISAISSFARNDSNHQVFDYSVGNLGGAISLSFKF